MCLLICFRITEVCECILLCCGRSVLCRNFYLKAVAAFLIKCSKIDSYRTFLYKDVIGNIMIGDHTDKGVDHTDNIDSSCVNDGLCQYSRILIRYGMMNQRYGIAVK